MRQNAAFCAEESGVMHNETGIDGLASEERIEALMETRKCKCATLPEVVKGSFSKPPSKHLEVVEEKGPPPALRPYVSARYPTYLMRCAACGQLWQCDAPKAKIYGVPDNWTLRCLKLATTKNWQSFDCTSLRVKQIAVEAGGHGTEVCQSSGCKNPVVLNKAFCESCLFHVMKVM